MAELRQQYDELSAKYEEKCLTLLIANADLYDFQRVAQSKTNELLWEINTLHNHHRMGNDKIHATLHQHKDKARALIIDTLKEGRNAGSQQATELQLLRADRDNRASQATTNLLDAIVMSVVHQAIMMYIADLPGRQQEMLTQGRILLSLVILKV